MEVRWKAAPEAPDRCADALAERAHAGVKVHLLTDWVGSKKMDATLQKTMEDAGVQIRKYHPLS